MPITLTNLGNIQKLLRNHFSAIDLFERAARIAIKEGKGVELANVYHNLGETYEDIKEYENAIFYFDKVVKLADNASIPFDPTNTFAQMAEVMKKQGRIEQALFYHQQVLQITREKNLKVGEINSLIKIGNCYYAKGEPSTAERYLVEGIFEATAIQRLDILEDAHFTLSKIYEQKGDYKQALKLNRLGAALNDSIANAETKRQLMDMQMLFSQEKQKRDLEFLAKENEVNKLKLSNKTNAIIFLSLGVIMTILIAILFKSFANVKASHNKILEREVKKRTEDLQKKERILTAQNKKLMAYAHMTSHVLRKPLANILGVINLLEAHEEDDDHSKDDMIKLIKDAAIEMDETVIHSIDILNEDFLESAEGKSSSANKPYNPVRAELEALKHQQV